MSEDSREQVRRHPRFRRSRPVVVHDGGRAECRYALLDVIGRGGAQLRSPCEFQPRERVELEICLSGGVIRVSSRVVDCRGTAGDHLIGVEFLHLDPDQEPLLSALLEDRD